MRPNTTVTDSWVTTELRLSGTLLAGERWLGVFSLAGLTLDNGAAAVFSRITDVRVEELDGHLVTRDVQALLTEEQARLNIVDRFSLVLENISDAELVLEDVRIIVGGEQAEGVLGDYERTPPPALSPDLQGFTVTSPNAVSLAATFRLLSAGGSGGASGSGSGSSSGSTSGSSSGSSSGSGSGSASSSGSGSGSSSGSVSTSGSGSGSTSGSGSGSSSGSGSGGGVGARHIIEDEGTPVPDQDTINFVGAGVAVTDSGGKTVVTIPGGMRRIAIVTLGSPAANIDFDSIPAGFNHLVAIGNLRGTNASTNVGIYVRVNNDSGTNYDWFRVYHTPGSSGNSNQASAAQWQVGYASAASDAANYASSFKAEFPAYDTTTFYKEYISQNSSQDGGSARYEIRSGVWKNTAAITRLTFIPESGNWAAGSTISLYGYPSE